MSVDNGHMAEKLQIQNKTFVFLHLYGSLSGAKVSLTIMSLFHVFVIFYNSLIFYLHMVYIYIGIFYRNTIFSQ